MMEFLLVVMLCILFAVLMLAIGTYQGTSEPDDQALDDLAESNEYVDDILSVSMDFFARFDKNPPLETALGTGKYEKIVRLASRQSVFRHLVPQPDGSAREYHMSVLDKLVDINSRFTALSNDLEGALTDSRPDDIKSFNESVQDCLDEYSKTREKIVSLLEKIYLSGEDDIQRQLAKKSLILAAIDAQNALSQFERLVSSIKSSKGDE